MYVAKENFSDLANWLKQFLLIYNARSGLLHGGGGGGWWNVSLNFWQFSLITKQFQNGTGWLCMEKHAKSFNS